MKRIPFCKNEGEEEGTYGTNTAITTGQNNAQTEHAGGGFLTTRASEAEIRILSTGRASTEHQRTDGSVVWNGWRELEEQGQGQFAMLQVQVSGGLKEEKRNLLRQLLDRAETKRSSTTSIAYCTRHCMVASLFSEANATPSEILRNTDPPPTRDMGRCAGVMTRGRRCFAQQGSNPRDVGMITSTPIKRDPLQKSRLRKSTELPYLKLRPEHIVRRSRTLGRAL